MKKLLSAALVLVTLFSLMLPLFASAESATPGGVLWVNCSDGKRLNLRTDPKAGSKILDRLDCRTRVTVHASVPAPKGWVYVRADGHKNAGFVMSKFLVSKKPGKYEITERDDNFRAVTPYFAAAKARNAKTEESVGLRTAPNKTAKMVRRLTAGDRLQVVAVGKTWSQVVDLLTGKTGYVANDYLDRI